MIRSLRHAAAVGAGIAAALVLSTVQPAGAQSPAAGPSPTLDPSGAAAAWLSTQFADGSRLPHPDGTHFGAQYGTTYYPDYGLNADAIFGLAAAHAGRAKIGVALDYLRAHVDDYADISNHDGFGPSDGAVGKLALAAIVAGAHPRHFGGYDLLRVLHRDECPAGATTCTPGSAANIYSSVSESFVALAEARAGSGPDAAAVQYLRSLQCTDGGFTVGTSACGAGEADVDATAYAIMAFSALPGAHPRVVQPALHWLISQQRPGGWWVAQGVANTNSTGLAAAAIYSIGNSRQIQHARAAARWLVSQQVPAGRPGAGAIAYSGTVQPTTTSVTSPSVLATAQTLLGLSTFSLATVSADGATRGVRFDRPRAALSSGRVRRGGYLTVRGVAFAAGERVRITLLDGTRLGAGSAGPLGVVRERIRMRPAVPPGRRTVVVHGLSSGLAARAHVVVRPATTSPMSAAARTAGASPATTGKYVGIWIKGSGVAGARCVAWHRGLTGDAILNKVATVAYRSDGLIVQIDGSPSSGTADASHFWSYWHDVGGRWHYSTAGASGYQPAPGTVEGWAFDNGEATAPKPAVAAGGLFAAICAGHTPSPTATPPVATPTPPAATRAHPERTPRPAPTPAALAGHRAPLRRAHTSSPPSSATASALPPAPVSSAAAPATAAARRHRSGRPHGGSGAPAPSSSTGTPARHPQPTVSLLAKPAAATSRTSALPTVLGGALIAVLLAGGAFAALRRRGAR